MIAQLRKVSFNQLLLISCLTSVWYPAFAQSSFSNTAKEIVLRTGLVTGQYQGQQVSNATFSADVNIQGELWFYNDQKTAWVVNAIISNESSLGRARYFSSGFGQRYFLWSDGNMIDQKAGDDFIQVKPNWAFYAGWDFSMSQFLVVPFTSTLASYSTLGGAGVTVGVKKILSPQLALNFQGGFSYNYSVFSSTSVAANIVQILGGVSYAF